MIGPRKVARLSSSLFLLAIAGCTVGPDFEKPKPPPVAAYTPEPLAPTSATPEVKAGNAQSFAPGQDIPAQWWVLFHSDPLDRLIARAIKNNPTIESAEAALAAARENVLAQKGAYYPSVSAGLTASRQKTSEQLQPTPNSGALYFNLFTPQVAVSYVPDVFGLNHRTVEFLDAQAQGARYALAAAHITLSANIVTAAVQEATLRAEIDATHRLVDVNRDLLTILQNQHSKGYASTLDVANQQSQLAQISATLPPLLKQLAQQRDLLTALSGAFPDKALPEEFTLSSFQLPDQLPLSLPSQLVEQRPDVLQAEANLHAASAEIGIAVANRLPNFTLTADAGLSSLTLSQLFNSSASFWNIGAGLTAPIFEGGALEHREKAARDNYLQAAGQYRSTVLTAVQNVADTLNALKQDADTLKAAAAAVQATKATFDLTRQQVLAGYANTVALSNAEIAYQQATINLVQAQANRYADTAALFLALGGGWWNQAELKDAGAEEQRAPVR